jgi:hypothetical protein
MYFLVYDIHSGDECSGRAGCLVTISASGFHPEAGTWERLFEDRLEGETIGMMYIAAFGEALSETVAEA